MKNELFVTDYLRVLCEKHADVHATRPKVPIPITVGCDQCRSDYHIQLLTEHDRKEEEPK